MLLGSSGKLYLFLSMWLRYPLQVQPKFAYTIAIQMHGFPYSKLQPHVEACMFKKKVTENL